ncbi:ubiquinone biosynthesis hydroxylase [Afifella marina]|uniref:2-octaprenyl-6-methoxyphenol hydroxylase n=1 Tax=Afifella marina DSM 2698 TaxID=1120955 RepID=A0A1G5NGC1_AFIMA|nr:ubiquinone biosynthesis hydroxylase [Afifella marina]MBK1623426.1 2-octaprenyl-6-methoxyphenyl hydroxylase [Afifella marina DSM 2698]MBK1626420.1 2-octaprenyl-6-methoxyphenyl hydroxylase [Afifella marina]MBK5917298.1 2-octaprenyl-6-methoxyphenyl hydroxylase [Afifella marina]RAI18050.1 2-octaprenyl-6-methoxyphenyl hydroxylase [Afifella marina DSM 2698]SCZ35779.1 2-octaprenyl-6-methoxyphenol hydroxylase [Afifella marina DSM 2698]
MADSKRADVVIAGGGSAGLTAALAIKRGAPDLDVMLIDAAGVKPAGADQRASAIAAAAKRMLETLDVWERVADEAQPINAMEITDSATGDAVRPIFLTFQEPLSDGEPFAHMVPNGALTAALQDASVAAGIEIVAPETVRDLTVDGSSVALSLGSGNRVDARLLVAADGVRSGLRGKAGIATVSWRYKQMAIVVTVAHERPHHGVAREHFLPSGPFAILPLKGNRSSLVWTEREADAKKLLAEDEFVFQIELERRFGHHLGELSLDGPRQGYPLGLTLARDFVRPHFALLGDAAHGIHPVAGQGLNLGFRDAAALAEIVVDANRLGLDIGHIETLKRYEQWRRFDSWQMGVTTDVLNRLFSKENKMLRAARSVGLGIVDRLPFLKQNFIKEAAGLGGELPRLMRGEAL